MKFNNLMYVILLYVTIQVTCKFFQYIKRICVQKKIFKVCKYINKFFVFLHLLKEYSYFR